MGLITKFKIYLKKKISKLIRDEINIVDYEKINAQNTSFQKVANFDIKSVRIDSTAFINNTQNNKNKISIGNNSWIKGCLQISKSGEIIIGDDCFIGEHSNIWASKKIIIGKRVLISHNVNIHDNISHPLDSKERHSDFLHIRYIGFQDVVNVPEKEIIIGDDVWIGFNCTILKGVTIGKGAIIGSNTTIKKDVPDYAVIVGNPAQIIKYTT